MDVGMPTLIVVTGRPGSGKSTLVPRLARAVRCPFVSRDEIKEGMVNTLGSEVDLAKSTNEAFFETIRLLLERKVSLIAEAAFQHRIWGSKLEEFRAIANLRIIVCDVPGDLARSRHDERANTDPTRGRFHDVGPLAESYYPPHVEVPTLTVDTSNGYDPSFEAIVAFAIFGSSIA